MDGGRFQKIQERSKERLRLEKSMVKLYGYTSEARHALPENLRQWLKVTRKRFMLLLLLKGKTKSEMLLGCDTAMELRVLKVVHSFDKEDKKLRPVMTCYG